MKKYHLIIFFGLLILIPFSRKRILEYAYGEKFNNERKKLELVQIGNEWEIDRDYGEVTFWRKPDPEIGHFKKVLEFTLFGLENEKDYYKKEWPNTDYVYTKYNYKEETLEYYSIISNHNLRISDNGWEPFITKQINKVEFQTFIKKEKTTANNK